MNDSPIPDGFAPLFRTSPVLDALGPFYGRGRGLDLVVGLRVTERQANARGTVHGGVISTMADVTLGYALAFSSDPPHFLVTANLSVDFLGAARLGDWIEARVDRSRIGRTLAFANAYLTVGDSEIARASAVFSVVAGKTMAPG